MRTLSLSVVDFDIRGDFRIARETRGTARVLVAELSQDGVTGRGESTPYKRYGETPESVIEQIEGVRTPLEAGIPRIALQHLLPAGAARNAIDCALWDLHAKRKGEPVWRLAHLRKPRALTTTFTLSIDAPMALHHAAEYAQGFPVLKMKLAGDDEDINRVQAVLEGAPDSRLIVDANEAMSIDQLNALAASVPKERIALIEQPLPEGKDQALEEYTGGAPLCADESIHTSADLAKLPPAYRCINVKLDKSGGLTEALHLSAKAKEKGLSVMVGCMVASSLAMAPAFLLAQNADFVDLDGPLLLSSDRPDGFSYDGAQMPPAPASLWG